MRTVGYVIYLEDDDFVVCEDCSRAYANYDASAISEREAMSDSLVCSECGCLLATYDMHPEISYEVCPNCNSHQYFLEVLNDGSVECSKCFWNSKDDDKLSFNEWIKKNK